MSWACAQTYGASEEKAAKWLRRQGFQAICPLYTKPRSQLTKYAAREAPVFPCYIFVNLEDGQNWGVVNSTYGVIRLLTDRNRDFPQPLWLPDSFMDKLGISVGRAEGQKVLIKDTLVRVKEKGHPFYDFEGRIVEMTNDQRISVLMRIFNQDTVVEFNDIQAFEVLETPQSV